MRGMNLAEIRGALPTEALLKVEGLPYPKLGSGKVREIFDLGDRLLIVATDRLSAFDVVMPDGVPGKGVLLTQISLWWFERTRDVIENHLVPDHDAVVARLTVGRPELRARSMVVKKLTPLPIEAVVRAYLAGSGWKEYKRTGKLFEHALPAGMRESQALPQPLFTPTTKAKAGHDEPITGAEGSKILGAPLFNKVRDTSLAVFQRGAEKAREAGLLLADTKFEFGLDEGGKLFLIDEVLTPDSSRFWPAADYEPGRAQHAFDKQYVRDYLETLSWNKTPPGPRLPADVIAATQQRYLEALEKLMGA